MAAVLADRFGMNLPMKLIIPIARSTPFLSVGSDILIMAFTFLSSGSTPHADSKSPKNVISCTSNWHLILLSFNPFYQTTCTTYANLSLCSFSDILHIIMPYTWHWTPSRPSRMSSTALWKISDADLMTKGIHKVITSVWCIEATIFGAFSSNFTCQKPCDVSCVLSSYLFMLWNLWVFTLHICSKICFRFLLCCSLFFWHTNNGCSSFARHSIIFITKSLCMLLS